MWVRCDKLLLENPVKDNASMRLLHSIRRDQILRRDPELVCRLVAGEGRAPRRGVEFVVQERVPTTRIR